MNGALLFAGLSLLMVRNKKFINYILTLCQNGCILYVLTQCQNVVRAVAQGHLRGGEKLLVRRRKLIARRRKLIARCKDHVPFRSGE